MARNGTGIEELPNIVRCDISRQSLAEHNEKRGPLPLLRADEKKQCRILYKHKLPENFFESERDEF